MLNFECRELFVFWHHKGTVPQKRDMSLILECVKQKTHLRTSFVITLHGTPAPLEVGVALVFKINQLQAEPQSEFCPLYLEHLANIEQQPLSHNLPPNSMKSFKFFWSLFRSCYLQRFHKWLFFPSNTGYWNFTYIYFITVQCVCVAVCTVLQAEKEKSS